MIVTVVVMVVLVVAKGLVEELVRIAVAEIVELGVKVTVGAIVKVVVRVSALVVQWYAPVAVLGRYKNACPHCLENCKCLSN